MRHYLALYLYGQVTLDIGWRRTVRFLKSVKAARLAWLWGDNHDSVCDPFFLTELFGQDNGWLQPAHIDRSDPWMEYTGMFKLAEDERF